MANDLNHSISFEDEINLREIIKTLIKSKKLIISTILIFTLASIIYSLSLKSSFKSSTKLEIGYVLMENGVRDFFESESEVISELKILALNSLNNESIDNLSINSNDKRVILLETISNSVEQNEELLNKLVNHISERHSNLEKFTDERRKKELSLDIERTKAEITYFKSKLSEQNQSKYMNIISKMENEEDKKIELLKLLVQNSKDEDKVFSLNNKLAILNHELENPYTAVNSKSQIIGNIQTNEIKPKTPLIISLGIIIGLFAGIFLTLSNNLIKSSRESEV